MLGHLDDAQIDDVLQTATIGRIGCRERNEVYVVPIMYAYHRGAVYAHSAEGRKLTLMRAAPDVCFEVEDVHGLSDWRSVVAWGRFEELHGDDAREALELLATRFSPSGATRPGAVPSHGHGTSSPPVLFRIRLLSCTGRFESSKTPARPDAAAAGSGAAPRHAGPAQWVEQEARRRRGGRTAG